MFVVVVERGGSVHYLLLAGYGTIEVRQLWLP
jgi:hypothetical protein